MNYLLNNKERTSYKRPYLFPHRSYFILSHSPFWCVLQSMRKVFFIEEITIFFPKSKLSFKGDSFSGISKLGEFLKNQFRCNNFYYFVDIPSYLFITLYVS